MLKVPAWAKIKENTTKVKEDGKGKISHRTALAKLEIRYNERGGCNRIVALHSICPHVDTYLHYIFYVFDYPNQTIDDREQTDHLT